MKSFKDYLEEVIKVPISVGDTVLGGKFKHKSLNKGDIQLFTKKYSAT